MAKYLIKSRNGRDKPRWGIGIFSHEKGHKENEFLMFSEGKTFATRKNATRYAKKRYGDVPTFLKW